MSAIHSRYYRNISLDTIANSATYFVGLWTPDLKRNQSRDLLRHLLSLMWFPCHGNLFNGRIRASYASLAHDLNLSREWANTLGNRLKEAKYIETYAPRLPNGKQEITIFRIGKRLKRVLVMLIKSKQRSKNRVNDQSQNVPTKEQIEKSKTFLAGLISDLGKKQDLKKTIRW